MPKLPDFLTDEEEADFWDTHSAADYWDQTMPVDERFEIVQRDKTLIPVRIGSTNMEKIRLIAARQGTSLQMLVNTWVLERLAAEISGSKAEANGIEERHEIVSG